MPEFELHQRVSLAELRPYVPGENLSGVSISEVDERNGSPTLGDMIARNPGNHQDKWLVAKAYYETNFQKTLYRSQTVQQWQVAAYANSCAKGWWEGATLDVNTILAKLMLGVTEIAEACEAVRDGEPMMRGGLGPDGSQSKPEGVGIELADALLRIFDLAQALGYNLQECLEVKHAYNMTRPRRHGGKLA